MRQRILLEIVWTLTFAAGLSRLTDKYLVIAFLCGWYFVKQLIQIWYNYHLDGENTNTRNTILQSVSSLQDVIEKNLKGISILRKMVNRHEFEIEGQTLIIKQIKPIAEANQIIIDQRKETLKGLLEAINKLERGFKLSSKTSFNQKVQLEALKTQVGKDYIKLAEQLEELEKYTKKQLEIHILW